MFVEIDGEALDKVVSNTISEDYKNVCQEVRRLKGIESPLPFEIQDLKDYQEYELAFRTLLRYYLWIEDANMLIMEYGNDEP